MEFLRVIKDGHDLSSVIDMPSSLKNRKVEVIIFPYEEPKVRTKPKSLRGALAKYKNKQLLAEELHAWGRSVMTKYEDR